MVRNSPVASVLITCHNRVEYVAQAIESVLVQRFSDLEVVVVDDASSDGSYEKAVEYARYDSRVRVFRNELNLGDYGNRNRAANLSQGTFIKYLDSDDLLYPHALEVMVPLMLSEPSAGIGLSLIRRIAGGPAPMLLTPRMAYQREFLGAGLFFGGPGDSIMRRTMFKEAGGFPDAGGASDFVFWLNACARANVLTLPADLTWHRLHPGQATHSRQAAIDLAKEVGYAWRAIHSSACPLTVKEVAAARVSLVRRMIGEVVSDFRNGDLTLIKVRLAHSGIGPWQLVQNLRSFPRDPLAGTPLDAGGEYLIPGWVRHRH